MAETIFQLSKTDVPLLTKSLLDEYAVYGPILKESFKDKNFFNFAKLEEPDELRLDYHYSYQTPIKVFFPNNEVLTTFKVSDISKTKEVVEKEKKVLFGVKTCDLYALSVMDNAFTKSPGDKHYLARRDDTIIIGLYCQSPCRDNAFCHDKGTNQIFDPHSPSGHHLYDLMFWDAGDKYVVQAATPQGEKFVKKNKSFGKFTGYFDQFVEDFQETQNKTFVKQIVKDFTMLKDEVHDAIIPTWESDMWNEFSEKCVSCGSCNYVCPTCNCFDTCETVELNLEDGQRCRKWDSCMNNDFAVVAGGENFREQQGTRLRHRVFKKEIYQLKQNGVSGCIGCGRCNCTCIADISLIDIFNKICS